MTMFEFIDTEIKAEIRAQELEKHLDKLHWLELQIRNYSNSTGVNVAPGGLISSNDEQAPGVELLAQLCSEYVELAQFIQKMELANGTD